MIVANRFFKTMVQSKPVEPRKITIREKISSLVNPESPVFYTKQTVLQSVQARPAERRGEERLCPAPSCGAACDARFLAIASLPGTSTARASR